MDSTVLTRWGTQIEGGAKGYNPKHQGRASHHPLLAFVADWRLIANFWLRPSNTSSANNALGFIEATLEKRTWGPRKRACFAPTVASGTGNRPTCRG